MGNYQFKPISIDSETLTEIAQFLSACFPVTTKFTLNYLKWLFKDNPFGIVQGFNAYFKDKLIAHHPTIPVSYIIEGELKLGLLTFNLATHPDHRGKGIFTELANRTYEMINSKNYSFAIAVANQNSTHGFISKLKFELVQQLNVIFGLGNFKRNAGDYDIRGERNQKFWDWRLANPSESYLITKDYITTRKRKKGLSPVLAMDHTLSETGKIGKMKLWIGIDENLKKKGLFFPLPEILKPSPLNLIFKDLTGNGYSLKGKRILFETADFDAY